MLKGFLLANILAADFSSASFSSCLAPYLFYLRVAFALNGLIV
jgi:hypothetical protein